MLTVSPNCLKGYELFHNGISALTDIEENGIRIDTNYVAKEKKRLTKQIGKIEKKFLKLPEVKKWRKRYGKEFNHGSDQQLGDMLYNVLGYSTEIRTATGNPSTSQEALEQLGSPMVESILQMRRYTKCRDTYLNNYELEQIDGFMHPFFHLHIPVSFRSSSSRINFQNQPSRLAEMVKIVRSGIIPRKGHVIVGWDYSGVEVSVAACYHKDPAMIQQIEDPSKDMHRDMAAMCYMLPTEEFMDGSKRAASIRHCGKNMFVFPQFYGDYYGNNAKDMWNAIDVVKLQTSAGRGLKAHLRRKGIKNLNYFTEHLKQVEAYFWGEKFPVYGKWKKSHYKKYCKNGYVDLLSGFRCSGYMGKNDAINYPIQGAAFHCLLWSLIHLNEWMKKNCKYSKLIGQIHDEIVGDIHKDEFNMVMKKAVEIMQEKINKFYDWLIVDLQVEADCTTLNGSWYTKNEIHKKDCGCGCEWMYKHKTETAVIWQCPFCSEKIEEKI